MFSILAKFFLQISLREWTLKPLSYLLLLHQVIVSIKLGFGKINELISLKKCSFVQQEYEGLQTKTEN